MPERIQRQRTKGWRAPARAVYVGRGSEWGNPFPVGATIQVHVPAAPAAGSIYGLQAALLITPQFAMDLYRAWLTDQPVLLQDARQVLAGRDLMCWCLPGEPCHADVLLEVVNGPGGESREEWATRHYDIEAGRQVVTQRDDRAAAERLFENLDQVWGHHAELIHRVVHTGPWRRVPRDA